MAKMAVAGASEITCTQCHETKHYLEFSHSSAGTRAEDGSIRHYYCKPCQGVLNRLANPSRLTFTHILTGQKYRGRKEFCPWPIDECRTSRPLEAEMEFGPLVPLQAPKPKVAAWRNAEFDAEVARDKAEHIANPNRRIEERIGKKSYVFVARVKGQPLTYVGESAEPWLLTGQGIIYPGMRAEIVDGFPCANGPEFKAEVLAMLFDLGIPGGDGWFACDADVIVDQIKGM